MLTKYAEPLQTLEVISVPKNAGADRISRIRRAAHRHHFDFQPRRGYIYVRSRAISSRTNDNFDEFPAEEIKAAYRTFIGKPVFVNHANADHRRGRGVIIDAALHEDLNPDGTPDTWAEVLMEIDAVRFPMLAKAVLSGDIARTSMGTDVAYSVCTACGNRAETPADYCQHIPKMKGMRVHRTLASGQREQVLVAERCYGLRFFENSLLVEDPADPTAYVLDVVDGSAVTATVEPEPPMAKAASRHQASDPALEVYVVEMEPGQWYYWLVDTMYDTEILQAGGPFGDIESAWKEATWDYSPSSRVVWRYPHTPWEHRPEYLSNFYLQHIQKGSAKVDPLREVEAGWDEFFNFLRGGIDERNQCAECGKSFIWSPAVHQFVCPQGHNSRPAMASKTSAMCSECNPGHGLPDTLCAPHGYMAKMRAQWGDRAPSGTFFGDGYFASKTADLDPVAYEGLERIRTTDDHRSLLRMIDENARMRQRLPAGHPSLVLLDAQDAAASDRLRVLQGSRREGFGHDIRDLTRELEHPGYKAPAPPKSHKAPTMVQSDNAVSIHVDHGPNSGGGSFQHQQELAAQTEKRVQRERARNQKQREQPEGHTALRRTAELDGEDQGFVDGYLVRPQKHHQGDSGEYAQEYASMYDIGFQQMSFDMLHRQHIDWSKATGEAKMVWDAATPEEQAKLTETYKDDRPWYRRMFSSLHHGYGETKAPTQVDTMRAENCPVCGDDEAFNGERCAVCGYQQPPEQFRDPDLGKAKEQDLRQDQQAEGLPPTIDEQGGTSELECTNCGEVFDAEGDDSQAGTTPGQEAPASPDAPDAEPPADPEDPEDAAPDEGDDEDDLSDLDNLDDDELDDELEATEPNDDVTDNDEPDPGTAEDQTDDDLSDLPIAVNMTCPICGEGTLIPKQEAAFDKPAEPDTNEVGKVPVSIKP